MDDPQLALFSITLIFFTAWLSWLSHRLNGGLQSIESSDKGVEEIGEALVQVISLLQSLPEYMKEQVQEYIPQFHINQQGPSWIQPLIESWMGNSGGLSNEPDLQRDSGGRFIDGTTQEKDD